MSSTFGTFNTARLGIYAAQKGLDVTGNNITNINTVGYTRQKLNQVSLVTTATDKYFSQYKTQVGQGVLTTGVSQIRDPGLDLLYRNAQANVGSADQKLAGLEDLAAILDEVGKGDGEQDDGVILNQLNDLRDLISQAVTNGIDDYDRLIQESANSLCILFNKYANELSDLKETYETYLNDDVTAVNDILDGIQKLNVSIRDADIRGDDALELRDQRNLLLDELSQYMKIDVKYTMEEVAPDLYVEKLTVSLATGNQDTLVEGEYASRISVDEDSGNYDINLHALRDLDGNKVDGTPVEDADFHTLGDNDLYGSIQSLRELLTEKGEYSTVAEGQADKNATTKRGIPYYQNALDSLAREFAEQMNRVNTPDGVTDGSYNLFSNGSNTNDATGITAANISVSKAWAEGTVSMVASMKDDGAGSGDTSNLAAFLDLFNQKQEFDPNDVVGGTGDDAAAGSVYKGTFEDMLLRIQSTLAQDQKSTTTVLTNYATTANELYTDRDSVSGVDLNDEATNLMVYQKAYVAACRLMTTLNTALDSLMAM